MTDAQAAPGWANRSALARGRGLVHLEVFGLDPHDLAVLPRRHRVSKALVQPPRVRCGLQERVVDGAAVFEKLLDSGFAISRASVPAANFQVTGSATRRPPSPRPLAMSLGPVTTDASYSRHRRAILQ
jgi:hypothetical protein